MSGNPSGDQPHAKIELLSPSSSESENWAFAQAFSRFFQFPVGKYLLVSRQSANVAENDPMVSIPQGAAQLAALPARTPLPPVR